MIRLTLYLQFLDNDSNSDLAPTSPILLRSKIIDKLLSLSNLYNDSNSDLAPSSPILL